MKTIIGLIGAPASGKDTIAEFFVRNKGFKKFAFADKIKEGFYEESGFSEEEFKEARGTDKELIIRDGLWEYSSNICKINGDDYFVKQVIEKVKEYNNLAIVSDIRTNIELKYLFNIGAQIILILRDYKEELKGKILPGTKILLKDIIEFPIFWNTFSDVSETNEALEDFCKEIQGDMIMDPDSSPGNYSK